MEIRDVASVPDFWKYIWERIVAQCKLLWEVISNTQPAQPSNKWQKFIRSALALFSNISSVFIYLVLLILAIKIVILWVAQNEKAMGFINNMQWTVLVTGLLLFILMRISS